MIKLLFAIFLLGACSEKKVYTGLELWKMAKDMDPKIEAVSITDPSKRILCIDYGDGCKAGSGKRILIRRVELIVVAFETEEQAKAEAKRINQYYARNWIFDDVTGEPVLEDFVKKTFKAKNPNLAAK